MKLEVTLQYILQPDMTTLETYWKLKVKIKIGKQFVANWAFLQLYY